ncbi:MAG: cadherin repeat domain-containing protein, partial [Candidatus Anammoximicrobium sp.]|nr:cadherin repeat domain-containing protein [Candidatus Anammoximicrobium sp.]
QAIGTAVGTFTSTDDEAPAAPFTYTLVSGTGDGDNGSFTIDGAELKTAAEFDFETKNSYSIRVRTTDAGGLWYEEACTITVTDQNLAPTDLMLSAASVAENQAIGTAVGTFTTTDGEAPAAPFTYTLVVGTGDGDNGSFTISGNQLKTAAEFDFETKNSYSIRVRTTDAGGLWYEEACTVTVLDVDDIAPTVTINQAADQPDPALWPPIRFTVAFSEPVTGLEADDVILEGSAPGTPSASVTGGPTVYTISVSGMSGDGTVVASVRAGAAVDAAGNPSEASTWTDNEVDFFLQAVQPVWRFDFDGFGGHAEAGYTGVSPWQAKAGNAFGWVETLPWYFERGSAADAGWDKLRYDGQTTNPMGEPVTFAVDVLAGKQYEVMILTGDTIWNHDQQQFQVYDANGTAPPELPDLTQPLPADTQVVSVWGAAAPDSMASTWGGGTPNASAGFYRWVRFTTGALADGGGGVGTLRMKMLDRGGSSGTTVILAMDVRAVDQVVPLTLERAEPEDTTPPFSSLAADGTTADWYRGSGAAAGAVLTVTVSANVTAGWPAQYTTVTPDVDPAMFGTQIQADEDGDFAFWVQRPATLTDTSAAMEDWTVTVQESSGLARATAIQPYRAPDAQESAPLRFDFGTATSPVQKYGTAMEKSFLQVIPQTIYNATRGYGWATRVAAGDRRDN